MDRGPLIIWLIAGVLMAGLPARGMGGCGCCDAGASGSAIQTTHESADRGACCGDRGTTTPSPAPFQPFGDDRGECEFPCCSSVLSLTLHRPLDAEVFLPPAERARSSAEPRLHPREVTLTLLRPPRA